MVALTGSEKKREANLLKGFWRSTPARSESGMTMHEVPLSRMPGIQLMRPGDSYEVPSGIDLMLETGNAGGLQITVGGKKLPPLGPTGQVRRNIPLDAELLLSGLN